MGMGNGKEDGELEKNKVEIKSREGIQVRKE